MSAPLGATLRLDPATPFGRPTAAPAVRTADALIVTGSTVVDAEAPFILAEVVGTLLEHLDETLDVEFATDRDRPDVLRHTGVTTVLVGSHLHVGVTLTLRLPRTAPPEHD